MVSTAAAQIKERSATLRRLTTALFFTLAALLVLERFGLVMVEVTLQGGFTADLWRLLAVRTLDAIPDACYLLALWWVREALDGFAKGALYTQTLPRMLERTGLALAIGAGIAVFLVPGASRLLGAGPGYFIAFDVSALVLAAIGLTLRVLAGVLRRAAELQAELDEMF